MTRLPIIAFTFTAVLAFAGCAGSTINPTTTAPPPATSQPRATTPPGSTGAFVW